MNFDDNDSDDIEEDEIIYLYLWESNKPIYDIYNILLNYVINEFYSLDSAILLALIADKELPITDTLRKIPYIHSGYLSVTVSSKPTNSEVEEEDV
jgi:hypothetical protein